MLGSDSHLNFPMDGIHWVEFESYLAFYFANPKICGTFDGLLGNSLVKNSFIFDVEHLRERERERGMAQGI